MEILGYDKFGNIRIVIDGTIQTVPDNFGNTTRNEIEKLVKAGATIPPYVPVITSQEVNQERDRRIASGFVFKGKLFDFDEASKQRITGAAALAGFAIATGKQRGDLLWHGGVDPFSWITHDNSTTQLDAFEMFTLGQEAAKHETIHIFAAREIKNQSPIPTNYQEDMYWPRVTL